VSSFDASRFRQQLAAEALGRDLAVHQQLPSTMDAAHDALARGAPHGHLVIADAQTQGRGRRGRRWCAAPGRHLTFSVVLRDVGVEGLTLAAGLAVARTLERFVRAPAKIKWPNDVWLGTPARKAAGILVEARSTGRPRDVVMGLGVNVGYERWPEGIEATSLHEHGATARREDVLAALLGELEESLGALREDGVPAVVRQVDQRLLWRGAVVSCDGVTGRLVGLDPSGALVLTARDGPRRLRAGILRLAPSD